MPKRDRSKVTLPLQEGDYERIENCRTDPAWKALSFGQKCRLLMMEKLNEIAPPETTVVELSTDQIAQISEFLKLLAGKRERNGISLAEIAEILGIEPDELNELIRKCSSRDNSYERQ